MMALDGYAARPPGTYSPTRPTGTWRVATIWPWGSTSRVAAGIEAARRLPQVGGQQLDRVAHRRGDRPQGGLQLGLWHARVVDVDAVEPAGQAPHRLVAALAHHPDHVGDGSAHLIAVLPAWAAGRGRRCQRPLT